MILERLNSQLEVLREYETNRTKIVTTNQSIATKAGFVFEELHKSDFNYKSISQGSTWWAYTDRSPGSPLRKNDPLCDLLICDRADHLKDFKIQVKAQSPSNTYKSLCRPEKDTNRNPYTLADSWLCTREGYNHINSEVTRNLAKEKYRAENGNPRPLAIANLNECIEKTVDHISICGINTPSLTLEEVKGEVENPWYSNQKRDELFLLRAAESFIENATHFGLHASTLPHAKATAIGNFCGDISEARAIFIENKGQFTGCCVNAGVNSLVQGSYDVVYGSAPGQQKKQIGLHVTASVMGAVANGFMEDSLMKGGIRLAADIVHLLIDYKYNERK